MSRYEDAKKSVEQIEAAAEKLDELKDISNELYYESLKELYTISTFPVLCDISLSLAVIADAVRDEDSHNETNSEALS